jgi:hypothetical protein
MLDITATPVLMLWHSLTRLQEQIMYLAKLCMRPV